MAWPSGRTGNLRIAPHWYKSSHGEAAVSLSKYLYTHCSVQDGYMNGFENVPISHKLKFGIN